MRDFPACARQRNPLTVQLIPAQLEICSQLRQIFSQPPGKERIAAGWRPTVIVLLLTKHSTSGAYPPSPGKAAGIWSNLLLCPGPIPCAAPFKKKKKSSWNLAFFLFLRREERTDSFLSGRTVIPLHHSVCETASEHCCSPGKHKKTTTKHGNSFTNAFIVINSNNTQKDVFVSSKLQPGNIYFCESLRRKRSQVCRHFRPTVYQTKYILWMKWFNLNTSLSFWRIWWVIPRWLTLKLASVVSTCKASGD